jgi:hypothetical protein
MENEEKAQLIYDAIDGTDFIVSRRHRFALNHECNVPLPTEELRKSSAPNQHKA